MANVKDWVAKIRAAVYGKDVRESIAASIEAMNNECEEAVGGYDEAIENAELAITQAQTGASAANSAASAANTAAERADKAAEAVEGLDVSQLVQMVRQLTPEMERFWRYEYGANYIDMIAAAFGGIVCYYCVVSTPDGLNGSITTDDGDLTDVRGLGKKFLPAVTLDGTPATPDNFNATFMAMTGVNHDITIRLSFLYQLGLEATDIEIKSSGNDLSFIATPGVIFLGMCKNQEEEPAALAARAVGTGTVRKTVGTLTGTTGTYTVDGYIVSVTLVDSVTKDQVLADVTYGSMTGSTNNTVTVSCAAKPKNPLDVLILYL